MKIFLVERTDRCDWDEYDAYTVAADDEQEAISELYEHYQSWNSRFTKVTYLGVASESLKRGVILASFNAG